jgi:Methyltransferase domain
MSIAYRRYWQRKQLLAKGVPYFPVRRWWEDEELCEIEQLYLSAVSESSSLLDVGAGDLRIMNKFKHAGYAGDYHTQDISDEYPHTYRTLDEIKREYEAVVCLDVLEHLPLDAGLELLDKMVRLIAVNGVLVLQTANARCVSNPLSWDMTHLHLYNINDLWAFLTAAGLQVHGYRILFATRTSSPLGHARALISRVVATQCLGLDYAQNICLIAQRVS